MAKPEAAIRVFGAEDAIPRERTGATTRRMRAANSPLQVFAGRWLRLRQIGRAGAQRMAARLAVPVAAGSTPGSGRLT
jgi:hypothetical protein